MSEMNPEWAHGTAHTASGWVIFMIALAIMVATHTLLDRIYGIVRKTRASGPEGVHA
jgi:hypothetical protein